MELGSFWRFSLLAFAFLSLFQPKFVAQAEVSSPGTKDRLYRLEGTPPEARVTQKSKVSVKADHSTKVLSAFETETTGASNPNDGKHEGHQTKRGLGKEAPIGVQTIKSNRVKMPAEKSGNISEDDQRRAAENILLESSFSETRKKKKRSVGATYNERSISGEAQGREMFVGTVQGVSNSRAEYRRTGGEARGSHPRQSEPHLDISTFALSGDSAHNQAMVHWSGHNSSVILILTKLFDTHLLAATESSLWRSNDYGSTYTKLNDKVASRTVLSYLYVCPTNKQKIMMLSGGDPEVEKAVLISSDEGASFEKYPINFKILSLLFHPAQENLILAYSDDSKLYSSTDFGRRWQLVHDNVMPGRFYWAVMGLDRESDVVHIETRIAKGRAQYVKCRAQQCTEDKRQYLFPGYVDTNSLVVQDEYVFTQVCGVIDYLILD